MAELHGLDPFAAAGQARGRLRGGEAAFRSREPLLGARQLAEALGVSRRWIYAQVEEHEMPVYRPPGGRTLLFRLSAVEAWLDAHRDGDWSAASCPDLDSAAGIPSNMQDVQVG